MFEEDWGYVVNYIGEYLYLVEGLFLIVLRNSRKFVIWRRFK